MASVADRVVEGPTRRCILTGQTAPVAGLLRLVAGPDDRLAVDFEARWPGRGAWVVARKSPLADAVAKGILTKKAARALKHERSLAVRADLAQHVEGYLRARCLDRLGLERRAGRAVSGFGQCHDLLQSGQAALLFSAADGAADGVAKLERLAGHWRLPILRLFGRDELGLAMGRENVVHAALKADAAVTPLLAAATKLAAFLGKDADQAVERMAEETQADGRA